MMKKLLWTVGLLSVLVSVVSAQYTNIVYSEPNDGMIEFRTGWAEPANHNENDSLFECWTGAFYGDDGLACTILPFQLPDLGAVTDPFDSAEISVFMHENNLFEANVDLYFLRTDTNSAIIATNDYYNGFGDPDPDVDLIAASFLTPSDSTGTHTADLSTELNAVYDGGAGAGDYVFLRLSYTSELPVEGAGNDNCKIYSRNSSNPNEWPTISLVSTLDSDEDGMPNGWEADNGLDPDDPTGVNGAGGNPDADGLTNLWEYVLGTHPTNAYTDADLLPDGFEVTTNAVDNFYFTDPLDPDSDDDYLNDDLEVNTYATNPNDADSDDDDVNDATEAYCGSDPNNPGDVPLNALPNIIGVDFFDYMNDSIWGRNGGEMFDIDNNVNNDPYVGHTCDISAWYDTSFNAADVVNQGLLTSGGNLGLRAFNGINTGGMSLGVFSADPATGSTASNLYFKVKMTLNGSVDYAGLSFYNGGTEKLFFGKTSESGTGAGEWGLDGADVTLVTAGYSPTNGITYSVVGKIDPSVTKVSLWLDPVIASGEGSATAVIDGAELDPDFTYNALRLASGGSGNVRWDDLVLAYTWDGLAYAGADSDSDSLRDTWELIFTNSLTVLASGADFDNDGLDDDVELDWLTDPTKKDSDGDGIEDGAEVSTYFTNPVNADTDDDGLSDGFEVTTNGVDNFYFTDPLDSDSDDDTYSDGVEVSAGTDPNNPTDNPGATGTVIIDGTLDAAIYGAPLAIQTVQTEFGDNQSELNAAYAHVNEGKLFLMLTGNIEDNNNKLEIFIDSADSGTTEVLDAVGNDNGNVMDGLTFDTGFTPDYHLHFRRDGNNVSIDIADLAAQTSDGYGNLFAGTGEGYAATGTGTVNAVAMDVAYDNSNTNGVIGGTAAADQGAATNVTTGFEISIDLSDLGNPSGLIQIAAMVNGNNRNYLSNQMLAGLPAPQGNLGGDGTGNFTGDLTGIDFTSFAGDQFFTVLQSGDIAPFGFTSIVTGATEIELVLSGLTLGRDYKIEDTDSLGSAFAEVPGSQFTATNATSQTVLVPADSAAERFFKALYVEP